MSDLDINQESGAEDKNGNEESESICLPAKKKKMRKGRRGGKGKNTKANRLSKLQEDNVLAGVSENGRFNSRFPK